ncbi:hypothetical protein [Streptomyces griseofuscus]|uniref:hypothetical protein n=1 Tax=Streptomyces griseofuscus TaxID=146922 RepID=UPI0037FC7D8A
MAMTAGFVGRAVESVDYSPRDPLDRRALRTVEPPDLSPVLHTDHLFHLTPMEPD